MAAPIDYLVSPFQTDSKFLPLAPTFGVPFAVPVHASTNGQVPFRDLQPSVSPRQNQLLAATNLNQELDGDKKEDSINVVELCKAEALGSCSCSGHPG
jgi:hypothetical protein